MNKRQIKLSCYLEQLNIEVVKVEMILNQERRKDINSIIHSNRFDFFEDYKVYVYSQKGQEEVNIIQLLDYAKKIFKEIV